MSAGSFLVACISKTTDELRAALASPDKPAADHGIPVDWAKFYLNDELHRSDRSSGRRK